MKGMKKLVTLSTLSLGVLTFSAAINAAPISKKLKFQSQPLQGQNIINLKKVLKQQYPGMNLQNKKIVAIDVVAKSKRGRASVALMVDGVSSYAKNIDGTPWQFRQRGAMDLVSLRNPAYSSSGRWKAVLNGNIKLRSITVKMRNKQRAPQWGGRISANCNVNTGGNFFKPKTKVSCQVSGKGAVSYAVKVDGITKWTGSLNPNRAQQRIETSKKKLLLNWDPQVKVIVTKKNGQKVRVH